jgi:hypothetical protein
MVRRYRENVERCVDVIRHRHPPSETDATFHLRGRQGLELGSVGPVAGDEQLDARRCVRNTSRALDEIVNLFSGALAR